MRTATSMSALEASRLLGVAKTTVTRAIKEGKLAAARGEDGRLWVEPAELARAFPEVAAKLVSTRVQLSPSAPSSTDAEASPNPLRTSAKSDAEAGAFQSEPTPVSGPSADFVKEGSETAVRLRQVQEERERERRQLEDTISDLRSRLDASEAERRQMTERVTALLTDQRGRTETQTRSWWHRLTR